MSLPPNILPASGPVQIRLAEPARDNPALCTLARSCPQGQQLRFSHVRDDHWERCRFFADSQVIAAEKAGQLVGAASLARKHVWIANQEAPAAYFFDLMVHPAYRRLGIARQLLTAQIAATAGAKLRYCLVIEDNRPSRRLFESAGFEPCPFPLIYHAIFPRLDRGGAPDLHLEQPVPGHLIGPYESGFRAEYDLVDSMEESGSGWFTVGAPRPRASAVLYEHGAKVLSRAPWYYHLGRWLLPGLPRLNTEVRIWELGFFSWTEPRDVHALLKGIAHAAHCAGVDVVLAPLYENDPAVGAIRPLTFNGWLLPPTQVRLYVHGELSPHVLGGVRPLLHSPRDG